MLYLGGGGSAKDESQLWDLVFQPSQRVAIWPFAQPPEMWQSTLQWLGTSLAERGEFNVFIGDSTLPDHGLANADILAVPGGNTFELLDYIRKHKLEAKFREFLARGSRYYGGSAGAILVGRDVGAADVRYGGLDDNTIGMTETRGWDLLEGWVIDPHFEVEGPRHLAVVEWVKGRGIKGVIRIPDDCGIAVDEKTGAVLNAGPGVVSIWTESEGYREHEPGAKWSLR